MKVAINKNTVVLYFVCFLSFIFSQNISAQTEAFTNKLNGYIKKGDSLVVVDDKYNNWDSKKWQSLKHTSVEDIVSLKLRYDSLSNFHNKPFALEVLVDIYSWQNDQKQKEPIVKRNISLKLNYDTAKGKLNRVIDNYRFENAHKISIVIKKINSAVFKDSLPPIFSLKTEIFVQRKYPFNNKEKIELNLLDVTKSKNSNQPFLESNKKFTPNDFKTTIDKTSQSAISSTSTLVDCGTAAEKVLLLIPPTLYTSVPFEYDLEYCFVDYDSEERQYIKTNYTNLS